MFLFRNIRHKNEFFKKFQIYKPVNIDNQLVIPFVGTSDLSLYNLPSFDLFTISLTNDLNY
jgi:hypothetical protein